MSPLGRYYFIAQGLRPGLIVSTHFLSSVGAALPRRKINARVIVPLLIGAHPTFVRVYPGFHFGLCPHCTLGFAGVACLRHSYITLNSNVLALEYTNKYRKQ